MSELQVDGVRRGGSLRLDRSACKAIVDRHVGPLMDAIGVSWWKVVVDYGVAAEDGDKRLAPGHRAAARVDYNVPYNRAVLTLDHDELDTEAEVVEVLTHELFHLVIAPFHLYRKFAAAFIDADSAQDSQEEVLFQFAMEQAVVGMERLWSLAPDYFAKMRDGHMPNVKGYSRKSISKNIRAEKAAGKKPSVALAIALSIAEKAAEDAGKPSKAPKRARRKKGG